MKRLLKAWEIWAVLASVAILVTTLHGVRIHKEVHELEEAQAVLKQEQLELKETISTLQEANEELYSNFILDVSCEKSQSEPGYDYAYVVSVVAGECGNEPFIGQMAVAQVIRQRAEDSGMNPEEVVRQPGQFIAKPVPINDIKEETWEACRLVLVEGEYAVEEPISSFCSIYTDSAFHNSLDYVTTIHHHKFYK